MKTKRLETKRTIIRKFNNTDYISAFKNWCNDEDVCKYLTWYPHKEIRVTKDLIDSWISSYNNEDYFHWAIVYKANKEVIGSIDYRKEENGTTYSVGYCIAKAYWHQGIMSEVFKETIRFMFEETNCQEIVASHETENEHSGMVMRKCGLVYAKNSTIFIKGKDKNMSEFHILKETYEGNIKAKQ